jgi:hypothetical protein
MYEFHGWATIRAIFENVDIDNEEQIMNIVVNKIKQHIGELNWQHGVLDIRAINAEFHVWTSGNHNHKPTGEYCPIEFFKYIAQIAPGSYGILYVLDDEDLINDNDNYFKVFVLAKGKITEHRDSYLSPFIPTVESFPLD